MPLQELAAHHVGFRYPAAPDVAALDDVDMRVRPGEMVALVGVNGSGKTTLAKVLAGLLPPSAGSVSWNGVDAAAIAPEAWRAQVAVVFHCATAGCRRLSLILGSASVAVLQTKRCCRSC